VVRRSYPPALWIDGLPVTTWRRRLRCLERGAVMRFGLFSAIDSGRWSGARGPVPARPCISGPRALASLLLTLRSDCSHVPQKATRRAVLYQTGCCFVATSMAMNQSKEAVELMNTLDASLSSWLVRLVMEWHYQQPATTVSGEKETSLSL